MMRVFIYILAFLELVLLLFFVAQYASGSGRGGNSGGAEMALFFLILPPLVVLTGATAVFHFTRWPVLRWTAAVVIAVPLLALATIAGQW